MGEEEEEEEVAVENTEDISKNAPVDTDPVPTTPKARCKVECTSDPNTVKRLNEVLSKAGFPRHSSATAKNSEAGDDDSSDSSIGDDLLLLSDDNLRSDPSAAGSDDEDETKEEDLLRNADWFTEEEALQRRERKISKLMECYEGQMAGLQESVRLRRRRQLRMRHLHSSGSQKRKDAGNERMRAKKMKICNSCAFLYPDSEPSMEDRHCKAVPLPYTNFCFAHILEDTDQKFYGPCSFTSAEGVVCKLPGPNAPPVRCYHHTTKQPAPPALQESEGGGREEEEPSPEAV